MVHAPDPLITCPLDESHRILKSRMQFHLVRCMKNHKLGLRMRCPWNPLHIIDKFAYEDHYKRDCEDIPSFICQTEETHDVASVSVTATNAVMPPAVEDWDADCGNVGTYDPAKNSAEKPVLRIAVGLSKSKRKAWREAERKRFQTLEANGPIQTKPRSIQVSTYEPKILRTPEEACIALSTDTSMFEKLDSSKVSVDNKNMEEDTIKPMRAPRAPSAALSCTDQSVSESVTRRNSFSSNDGSRMMAELPKLCQSLLGASIHETASRRSSICSHDKIEAVRRTLEQGLRVNNTMHCLSDAETSALFEEASCLPNLAAPDVAIRQINPENDTVWALSQQFAELTAEQKKIEDQKKLLVEQMSMLQLPKLVGSVAPHNRTHDDTKFNETVSIKEDSPPTKQQQRFLAGISKCAANFPRFQRNENPTNAGIRRGIMAFDCFGNCQPAMRNDIDDGLSTPHRLPTENETNPFLIMDGNISQRTYTISIGNADEENTICGYDEED